ncbi:MAG: toxic anion resistance protein [Stomatobaculum sp.]|nr:toxic anion resistance protein [Stomatobaculum sp.]
MAFNLDIPDVEEVKEKVEKELEVPAEREATVDEAAKQKVEEIMGTDITVFEDRKNITAAFQEFGADVIRKTEAKNGILSKRMVEFSRGSAETGEVAKGLAELSAQMKTLDPSAVNFEEKGLFGKIANPVKRYFDKYKTADAEIADIVKSLDSGKKMLQNDNVTLELEEQELFGLSKQLNEKVAMGNALDQYLTNAIDNKRAEGGDEAKVQFVEEEILFPLRQRIMDFQQLQVVSQQGVVALDVIRRNNNELVRAVERAKTVTVSSLRTAVTVAGALYNQKLVLEKVNLLNQSTNNMIAATSNMLKTQGVEIQKNASEAMISTDTLRKSFADTLQALDDISSYKLEALPRMRQTIEEFRQLADEGTKKLDQMEEAGRFVLESPAEPEQEKLPQ